MDDIWRILLYVWLWKINGYILQIFTCYIAWFCVVQEMKTLVCVLVLTDGLYGQCEGWGEHTGVELSGACTHVA